MQSYIVQAFLRFGLRLRYPEGLSTALKPFPHLWVHVGGSQLYMCNPPPPPHILGQSKPLEWSSSVSVSGYFTAGLK